MAKHPPCEHQVIYSGRTNLDRKFEFICRWCGEHGWHDRYVFQQVDAYEFFRLRVLHGWEPFPGPGLLPSTPPPRRRTGPWVTLAALNGGFLCPQIAIALMGMATTWTWVTLGVAGSVFALSLWKVFGR